jgi:predicted ArsR family transcriptional regulator
MDDLDRIASLQDPVRRRLYEYVRGRGGPVGREEAGRAVGIGRSLAAYHLDKLEEQGLLVTTYRRPDGRDGPGAGRPAKLYAPAEQEVTVSVPPRDYEFLARMLVGAAEDDQGGRAGQALREVAAGAGRQAGEGKRDVEAALRTRGYEPAREEDGSVCLRNCPFHALAVDHRDVVCDMNLAFMAGLLEGMEREDLEASFEPRPGRCCVTLRPR